MTTKAATSDKELKLFQELVGKMKKMPGWDEHSEPAKTLDDLCTNPSKEARDVREIMWRMIGAELKAKDLKQNQQG